MGCTVELRGLVVGLEASALMTLCKLQAKQYAAGSNVCMALPCSQPNCVLHSIQHAEAILICKALSPVLIIAIQQLHLGITLYGLVDIPAQQMVPQV